MANLDLATISAVVDKMIAEAAKENARITEQLVEARIQAAQHTMQEYVHSLVQQLADRDAYIEQLILAREYPNDFTVLADGAWRRFIEGEWERLYKVWDKGDDPLTLDEDDNQTALEFDAPISD